MAAIVPHRFLVRPCHPVKYVAKMPPPMDDTFFLDLPTSAAIHNFAELDGQTNFADVRLAWNELGLGVQVRVPNKKQPPEGSSESPRAADGLTFWIDTRSDRTSHRASRYCHQFIVLPCVDDAKDLWFSQVKINRALQDAPLCSPNDVMLSVTINNHAAYDLSVFLPAAVLTGYDPEQHPRLGFYYHVRDQELGDQYLSVNGDFPFTDDPSLWSTIELVKK